MRWLWIAGAILLTVAALSVWFAFQRPDFVAALSAAAVAAAVRAVVPAIGKRMDPEDEAAWRDCQRRGGRWDNVTKRCTERK